MTQDDPFGTIGEFTERHIKEILIAIAAYTIGTTAILSLFDWLPSLVRIPLSLPIILVIPGFAIVTAAVPVVERTRSTQSAQTLGGNGQTRVQLAPLERGAISIFVSIVVVASITLLETLTVGIDAVLIFMGLTAITVLASAIGILRTPETASGGPPAQRASQSIPRQVFQGLTRGMTPIAIIFIAVLLTLSGVYSVTGATNAPMSEFYVSDRSVDQTNTTVVNETFHLNIEQHSDVRQNYTVVVTQFGDQASSSDEIQRFSMSVPSEATAERTYQPNVSIPNSNSTLQFLLYQGNAPQAVAPQTAHRVLKVTIDESSG